jgi:16S rRNA (guanine527-N7)-methyltransferase
MSENQFGAPFCDRLRRIFEQNRLDGYLTPEKIGRLADLAAHLVRENGKYNLTAVTDPDGIILRHFADSAALASYPDEGARLLDVGCGAGFPSLVLAVLRPDLSVTAIDSTEKRIRYVTGAAELLGLSNLTAAAMRAEDGARPGNPMRGSFDIVTARAVARLPVLAELCLPYVRLGGEFLAMKGSDAEAELAEAARAIPILGGAVLETVEGTLVGADGEAVSRPVIRIGKVKETPEIYPRAYARIAKRPL